jgi:iron(III) transport system permease protein
MSIDVLGRPRAEKITLSWLSGANSALLWVLVFVLVLYPLLMVLAAAFTPTFPDSESLKISDFMTERLLSAGANTIHLGLSVSFLSLITGCALALLATQSRRDHWIDLLMSIPFLTPPFLASLAWSLAVGPKGYLGRMGLFGRGAEQLIFSFWGLSLVMAAHYAPMVYFAVRSQIDKISSSLLWAGRIAGAAPGTVIKRILFPMIFPALLAGSFLAFASAIEEYGTPLVIGNRIGFPVIATEIGRVVRVYPINLSLASALASILFTLVGSIYFLSYLLQRHAKAATKTCGYAAPNLLSAGARAGLWAFAAIYALFALAIPYGSMLITSLLKLVSAGPSPGNLTLANYLHALTEDSSGLRDALFTSLSLALFAALVGILLGAACARAGFALTSMALVPAATPAITMAVGFIRGWNAPWTDWLPLYGSVVIVGLFYTAQYLSYAVQYARAGLATIPPSYEWAARIHGAHRVTTTARIVAPLLWPHALAGGVLIFSISFRELVGSVLLRPPGLQTVSTFILREFDQGSPATGMAMGVIAICVALASISLARWLVPRRA